MLDRSCLKPKLAQSELKKLHTLLQVKQIKQEKHLNNTKKLFFFYTFLTIKVFSININFLKRILSYRSHCIFHI